MGWSQEWGGLPRRHGGKEPACQCRRCARCRCDPWVGKIPWSRKWHPTPIFLLEKSHGQRSVTDYSPRGCKKSDVTEQARVRTHTQEWRLSGRCTWQILNDNEKETVRVIFFFPVWTGNRIVTKFLFLHCANPILNDKGLCQIVLDLAQYLTLEQLSRRLDCSWGENALWTWFLNRIRWIPLFSAFKSNTACGCMKAVPDNFAAICLYHSLRKCLDFSNEMLLSLEKDWRETK